MGDLKAVLSALQGAKGGSREIDAEVARALGGTAWIAAPGTREMFGFDWCVRWPGEPPMLQLPTYTASVDAALALVAEKLPGHTYLIGRGKTRPEEPLHGVFFSPDGSMKAGPEGSDWPVEVEHESLPICILIALFSALHEGGSTNG